MSHRRRRGFTLIEVLLVLVILVILGSLVGIQIRSAQKSAFVRDAKIQVLNFGPALDMYMLHMGNYPPSLENLVSAPGDTKGKWEGPYLDKVPLDPWGHAFLYANPGRHKPDSYDAWSVGPDGAEGTDDDIGNW